VNSPKTALTRRVLGTKERAYRNVTPHFLLVCGARLAEDSPLQFDFPTEKSYFRKYLGILFPRDATSAGSAFRSARGADFTPAAGAPKLKFR